VWTDVEVKLTLSHTYRHSHTRINVKQTVRECFCDKCMARDGGREGVMLRNGAISACSAVWPLQHKLKRERHSEDREMDCLCLLLW